MDTKFEWTASGSGKGMAAVDEEDHDVNGYDNRLLWGDVENSLTEDLVEKIVSKIQFPQIFKARALSKHWYSKFRHIYQGHLKPLRSPFQDEVELAASHRWLTYCPAYVSDGGMCGALITGFNWKTGTWHKIRIHPRFPYPPNRWIQLSHPQLVAPRWDPQLRGSMLFYDGSSKEAEMQLIVANVLTGTWRALPACQRPTACAWLHVISCDADGYKVLLYGVTSIFDQTYHRHHPMFLHHVYDSNVRCWSSRSWSLATNGIFDDMWDRRSLSTGIGYVDGNVYLLCRKYERLIVIKHDTNTAAQSQTDISRTVSREKERLDGAEVFQWGSAVLVVLVFRVQALERRGILTVWSRTECKARVYQLDLDSLELTELSESPPGMLAANRFRAVTGSADCLYFLCGNDEGYNKTLSLSSYSMSKQTWCRHPAPPLDLKNFSNCHFSCFQPGLNPFATV